MPNYEQKPPYVKPEIKTVTPEKEWNPKEFLYALFHLHDSPQSKERFDLWYKIKWAGLSASTFNAYATQFAEHWKDAVEATALYAEFIELLRSRVDGKTMIDLGGGVTTDGEKFAPSFMQKVAEKLGAKVYINIDRFLPVESPTDEEGPPTVYYDDTEKLGIPQPENGMRVIYTKADLLLGLAKMQTESPGVVLVLNGINQEVVDETPLLRYGVFKRGDKLYHQSVAEEIARVLPKGSVVLCTNSEATKYFEGLGLKLLDTMSDPLEVWTKE